jgi:hypothetical protein
LNRSRIIASAYFCSWSCAFRFITGQSRGSIVHCLKRCDNQTLFHSAVAEECSSQKQASTKCSVPSSSYSSYTKRPDNSSTTAPSQSSDHSVTPRYAFDADHQLWHRAMPSTNTSLNRHSSASHDRPRGSRVQVANERKPSGPQFSRRVRSAQPCVALLLVARTTENRRCGISGLPPVAASCHHRSQVQIPAARPKS